MRERGILKTVGVPTVIGVFAHRHYCTITMQSKLVIGGGGGSSKTKADIDLDINSQNSKHTGKHYYYWL